MQNMKKAKVDKNINQVPKQKERHIVSWSTEEDDILRQQIEKHGTDNWTIIASNFKDKTTRQCRRRWYTYLNSDFKKGGWSPEEDLLLCEAQKLFGNRWTEIAKVVSGRTDNAVKNRFSTLCKKRAKHEALAKENNAFINLNYKRRVIFPDGDGDGVSESAKKMRFHVSSPSETQSSAGKPTEEYVRTDQLLRPPFAVLAQNFPTFNNQHPEIAHAADNKAQGTFLKKDDLRILTLAQQAELLSSLALKANSEDTNQSLENAWQVLEDPLNRTKDGYLANPYTICDPFNLKELVEDSSSNECSQPALRQYHHHTSSPSNSDYSTGSTRFITVDHISVSDPVDENGIVVLENIDMECSSPIKVTPLFRSLAEAVPTPNFSESERHFLLRALGLESTSPNRSSNPTKPPQCKRVLLQSL